MTDCIFPRRLDRPEMNELTLPVTEATDSELKALVALMVKCSCLEVSSCCSSTTKYEVCCLLGCRRNDTTRLGGAGCITWLAGTWIYSLAACWHLDLFLGRGCCDFH